MHKNSLKFITAGISLAVLSSISGLTGWTALVTSAGFPWPWLWIGFAVPYLLRSHSRCFLAAYGSASTGLFLAFETGIDVLLDAGASLEPGVEAIYWFFIGCASGAITTSLGILSTSQSRWRYVGILIFGVIVSASFKWAIRWPFSLNLEVIFWLSLWALLNFCLLTWAAISKPQSKVLRT